MSRFVWGKIINTFNYDFDGRTVEVVKYHPWKVKDSFVLKGEANMDKCLYHCDELHESFYDVYTLIIAIIANDNLGRNQTALVNGISKSLDCNQGAK